MICLEILFYQDLIDWGLKLALSVKKIDIQSSCLLQSASFSSTAIEQIGQVFWMNPIDEQVSQF